MRSLALGIVLALGLAGCGDGGGDAGGDGAAAIHIQNEYSDKLKAMSELYRYLGLRRAIVDNGQICKKVTLGAYQEEYKSMAMWVARCSDTGDWAIFLAPNGQVQATRCYYAEKAGLPKCRLEEDAGTQGQEKASTKG